MVFIIYNVRRGAQLLSYAWNSSVRTPENQSRWFLLGGVIGGWEGDFTFCTVEILNHVNELPITNNINAMIFFFKKKKGEKRREEMVRQRKKRKTQ